ncbi:hypothetical protein DV096_14285 [Bradymonadaceae bacterium TMQ3]|uniref:Uncharacterized protein n=1 Tax=Lujinxingia sediminis TaxID=2480984 RepID=A0ABY0CVG2_9DELT|nr:hypothetical protein [Lujinxingia sediminis]RDV37149.1 hypothetical protein DV096_14285 [Bradymonadaceae bacterium TMQ3]RVU46903.1 hypothetical protein EA187_07145 [Lujinxingia sediminis]TXC74910.1 hypothetical protein FRC91_15280 [Bradymonadales bacterium TMQ1]
MREKMWWMAAVLSGAVMVAGCGGEDVGQDDVSGEDVGDVSDAGGDAGDVEDDGGEDSDVISDVGDDADVENDIGPDADVEDDAGDVVVPDDCPSGQRANKTSGECEVVPTLLVYTQDLQSYRDGELASEQRGVLVCASASETSGSLPRVALAQGERCRVYGEGLSEPPEITAYDAGPVTLVGLNPVNPAAYTPSEFGSCYQPPSGMVGQFLFDREAELRVISAGTEGEVEAEFPAFNRTIQTIAPADFSHDPIAPGEAMELSWTPNADASEVRLDVDARGADGSHVTIVCEVADNGRYVIPAELTEYLPEERTSAFVYLEQSHTERIEPEDSNVLIMLSTGAAVRKR